MCNERSGLTGFHGFSQDAIVPLSISPVHGEVISGDREFVKMVLLPGQQHFSLQAPDMNPIDPSRRFVGLGVKGINIEREMNRVLGYEITMTPQPERIPIVLLDAFLQKGKVSGKISRKAVLDDLIPTYLITNNELSLHSDDDALVTFDEKGFDINFDVLKLDEAYQREGKRAYETRERFPYGFECEVMHATFIDGAKQLDYSFRAGFDYSFGDFPTISSEVSALVQAQNFEGLYAVINPFLRIDVEERPRV